MSENRQITFRTVLRGYDPGQVDWQMDEYTSRVREARGRVEALTDRVGQLTTELEHAREQAAKPGSHAAVVLPNAAVSFADFGEHIGQILTIAEQEADGIRSAAVADAQRAHDEFETSVAAARSEADRYAKDTRAAADREAARILDETHRSVEALLDDATRHATARNKEAELFVDQQRAKAGKAAADFEQTLAERRETAEAVLKERTALGEQQLTEAQQLVIRLRTEGEQAHAEAVRRAARLSVESEQAAAQTIADAVARADRIRVESDREMAAATQRRDSINAQLANVRQMLATTSEAGSSVPTVLPPAAAVAPVAPVAPVVPAPVGAPAVSAPVGPVEPAEADSAGASVASGPDSDGATAPLAITAEPSGSSVPLVADAFVGFEQVANHHVPTS